MMMLMWILCLFLISVMFHYTSLWLSLKYCLFQVHPVNSVYLSSYMFPLRCWCKESSNEESVMTTWKKREETWGWNFFQQHITEIQEAQLFRPTNCTDTPVWGHLQCEDSEDYDPKPSECGVFFYSSYHWWQVRPLQTWHYCCYSQILTPMLF